MRIKTIIAVTLVSLLCMPAVAKQLNATEEQNKLNKEIYEQYFSQKEKPGNTELSALATYLRSIPQLPQQAISDRSVQRWYVTKRFDKNTPSSANTFGVRKIKVTLADNPQVTQDMDVVVVSPSAAISYGFTKKYQEEFKANANQYNPQNYIAFYEPYKGTWLAKFLEETMLEQWTNQWNYKIRKGEYLYKIFELGPEIPLYKHLPKLSETDVKDFVAFAEKENDYQTIHFFFDVQKKPVPQEVIQRRVCNAFHKGKAGSCNK